MESSSLATSTATVRELNISPCFFLGKLEGPRDCFDIEFKGDAETPEFIQKTFIIR
jgi:hypothetical protein